MGSRRNPHHFHPDVFWYLTANEVRKLSYDEENWYQTDLWIWKRKYGLLPRNKGDLDIPKFGVSSTFNQVNLNQVRYLVQQISLLSRENSVTCHDINSTSTNLYFSFFYYYYFFTHLTKCIVNPISSFHAYLITLGSACE